jgi:UDP-2-acetamido-2-deoxy-ribo-hexuluronate aminotransferase
MMQFIDLHAQQKRIREKIETNIRKVLDHGKYIMGPEITELERKLAEYVGTEHAVGVASGTDALAISLLAHDIKPSDVVFTSPFTFIATAEVIQLLGATPVFVDIQEDTYNIDPDLLEAAIKKVMDRADLRPRGIIAVDIFGQPADYDEIEKIAEKYDLFVLEDAAQSFGAVYKDRKACSLSQVACTSFFPAKPLGAYGDGGMIFTRSREMYDSLVSIRVHGAGRDKYDNIRVGINGRLDTLQAAVLLAKFSIFEEEISLRQRVARDYNWGLEGIVVTPAVRNYNVSAWAQYSVQHPERDKIRDLLQADGIPTAIYYPIPLHMQKAFADLGYRKGDFPVSEKVAERIFSLPMHPYLASEDQERIIESVRRYASVG